MLSKCPDIVDLYGLCIHEGSMLLCMELMDLSLYDLYHIFQKQEKVLPETLVGYIFVKMVDALCFCNSKGVMHRDIKPSNILVNYSGEIKLCDFGESRVLDHSFASTHVGTIAYWPPERFSIDPGKYDDRAEVWSLGITLMEIILGRLPYILDEEKFQNEIQQVDYAFMIRQYVIKASFVEVITRYIEPKYSISLCQTLELCTRKIDERPKLKYLDKVRLYESYNRIDKEEIKSILQDIA